MSSSHKECPLTVLIATHGRPDLLERTLKSLAACERPDNYLETIVVENGGVHGAEDVVIRAAPELKLRYLYLPEGNKSAALNHALQSTQDGLVIFIDDDVRLQSDFLLIYDRAAAGVTNGRYYGGPVKVDYESTPPDWLLEFLPLSARGWEPGERDASKKTRLFLGANWAAFAGDLKRCGGFNPQVGPGGTSGAVGQDTEMQQRLSEAGGEGIYIRDAVLWHYVPRDRCTPRWAVQRAYKAAIFRTLHSHEEVPTLCGLPRPELPDLTRHFFAWCLSRFRTDPYKRFQAARRLRRSLGRIQGHRMRTRSHASGDTPKTSTDA